MFRQQVTRAFARTRRWRRLRHRRRLAGVRNDNCAGTHDICTRSLARPQQLILLRQCRRQRVVRQRHRDARSGRCCRACTYYSCSMRGCRARKRCACSAAAQSTRRRNHKGARLTARREPEVCECCMLSTGCRPRCVCSSQVRCHPFSDDGSFLSRRCRAADGFPCGMGSCLETCRRCGGCGFRHSVMPQSLHQFAKLRLLHAQPPLHRTHGNLVRRCSRLALKHHLRDASAHRRPCCEG